MFIITGFVKRISSCERELNAICIYAKYILQRLPEKLSSLLQDRTFSPISHQ